MNTNPPCLIVPGTAVPFVAWNEDGRMIQWSDSWRTLDALVRRYGYEPVHPNSRCARTILDKIANPTRHL